MDQEILDIIKSTSQLISKKWSVDILFHLFGGNYRYSELTDLIPELSNKMLSERLKELYDSELITKTVLNIMPLIIKYGISEKGIKFGKLMFESVIIGNELEGRNLSEDKFKIIKHYFELK